MIFGKLILGGFGILMSNMSHVQTILLFQGCDKIVLRLHTARTESPDTPKHIPVPPISMNITQIPPDTHQTSLRHLQGAAADAATNAETKDDYENDDEYDKPSLKFTSMMNCSH